MQRKPRGSAENNVIALLNFIADLAVIVDGKGRFLVVNDAIVDLTGLNKKELIGTAFLELNILDTENKAILSKNFEKRLKGLLVEPYEIYFKNQTGETLCTEVEAKKFAYNRQPADLVLLHERALIDETGTAVEFNEGAHRQLGYTREEFAKLVVSDYEVIETLEGTSARMKRIMQERKDEFETKHRTKNGEIRDVINTVQVIELA
jgi:PAS domain S-box-containing protein